MIGINRVILIGNVGGEPQTRYIKKGFSSSTFSFATKELVKSVIGSQVEEVEWHQIVAYGELSSFIERYIHTGDSLYVEGKLKSRYIRESDGFRTKIVEIFADKIQLLNRSQNNSNTPMPQDDFDNFEIDDDDIEDMDDRIGEAIPDFDIDNLPFMERGQDGDQNRNIAADTLPF